MKTLKLLSLLCLLNTAVLNFVGAEYKREPIDLGKIDAMAAKLAVGGSCKGSVSLNYGSLKQLCAAMEYNHQDIILNEPNPQCKKALERLASHIEQQQTKKIDQELLRKEIPTEKEIVEIWQHCLKTDAFSKVIGDSYHLFKTQPNSLMQQVTYEPCLKVLKEPAARIEAQRKQKIEEQQKRLRELRAKLAQANQKSKAQ